MPVIITKAIVDTAKAAPGLEGFKAHELTDAKSQGLELRVRPRGVMWCFRYKVAGASKRLTIAAVDLLSIAEARQVASDAAAVNRSGGALDESWMMKRLVQLGKIDAVPEPQRILWTFAEGRTEWLAEIERTLSEATHADYSQILKSKDLAHLDDRQLHSITRPEIAEILKAIHQSGRETHSDHVLRVVRPFFNWLGADAQTNASGVQPGLCLGMKAPPRSRVDDDDGEDHGTYVPDLAEMASAILCARVGYDPIYAGAIELLIWTVQRRRAIVEARVQDFKARADGLTGLWLVPSASRKGRRRNGKKKRPLVIPLPEPVWNCLATIAAARGDTESQWLFPADSKSGHINVTTLTHYLSYLPGIRASPHDIRRGFATYGEAVLGLRRSDTNALLDHEDEPSWKELTHRSVTPAASMTGIHYSLHDGTHRTWPIMITWTGALQAEMDRLMSDRPNLFEREWVIERRKTNKKITKDQRNAYVPLMPIAAE